MHQAVPIGINLSSPVTWFVIAVTLIVLALTVSTRRGSVRQQSGFSGAPIAPSSNTARERFTSEWSAAQLLFVDDPHAGCERAQSIVTSVLRDRGFVLDAPASLDPRYRLASEIVLRADASTDDLRAAFIHFRDVFESLLAGAPDSVRLPNT